jgi:hypothetical protein
VHGHEINSHDGRTRYDRRRPPMKRLAGNIRLYRWCRVDLASTGASGDHGNEHQKQHRIAVHCGTVSKHVGSDTTQTELHIIQRMTARMFIARREGQDLRVSGLNRLCSCQALSLAFALSQLYNQRRPVAVDRKGIAMKVALFTNLAVLFACLCFAQATCRAQTIVNSDFSKGDFAALGWKADGAWDVFMYPKEVANNPGCVARFGANMPRGELIRVFDEIKNPRKLTLSLEYGWGWGDADQGGETTSPIIGA